MKGDLYRVDYGGPAGDTDVAEEQLDAYHMVEALKRDGFLVPVSGVLTRAEWRDTIDHEAAVRFALSEVEKGLVYTEAEYEQAMREQVHGIVDAALGGDG